jgi:predicted dehydrogenase
VESKQQMSRREFVAKSGIGVGALGLGTLFLPSRVFGANERLSLGMVGPGGRGGALMAEAHKLEQSHNVQFTAVCDIWNQRREAAAKKVGDWNGQAPRQCRTLEEICNLPDVDVLLIATPDFAHAYHLAYAVRAGKDVYVEKPLGCDFAQLKNAYKAVKETGRVVQMGTQARGAGKYFGARDFIKSGGLGKVTYVEIYEPLFQQRWRIYGCETSLTEEDTNWKEFLCYLSPKEHKWNPRHYREFRLFWPFSSGCFCQWMSHKIDLVNLALDEWPRSAVANGGVYLWKDGRTNPDTVQCLLEYPSGVLATYHMRLGNGAGGRGITIYGTNGTMELDAGIAYGDGGGGEVTAEHPGDPMTRFSVDKSKLLKAKAEGGVRWESPPDVSHMGHFFECVRSRERTRADIDAGFGHALATTLANMSWRTGCRLDYDAEKMEMRKAKA